MPRKFHKYTLLLDEGFPTRKYFPRLNDRHRPRHIVEDLKQGGILDEKVYAIASKEHMIVVTYNYKDFKDFAKDKKAGVIGVSSNLDISQIDKKLVSILNKKKPKELYGNCYFISGETK